MEKRLGKGLGALIPETPMGKAIEKIEHVRLSEIVPNRFQPRKRFAENKMEELMSSIREKGVIQPILVRQRGEGYELIAGERRWRAARELQLEDIPVIIKKGVDDVSSLEMSMIENIQREDFNPIEEADAYRELIDQFGYTLEKIGQEVGKDKTTISNSMRLLNLSAEIQGHIEEGVISVGHAKVLLSIPNEYRRSKTAQTIVRHGLSVRQLEQMIKTKGSKTREHPQKDPEVQKVEEDLQHHLGTKVTIRHGGKRGRIEIQYYSNEDLQRVLDIIMR
ncbi:MAG: ParB/RepB/Spo0J family partition protein [Candidatus Omnitrophica bacterium]|nr:ParB/RepB/Spo0J family partition protein [Candidatus Omnitrophota bacterium]MBU1128719.1 ParB/RepB/Spo0J family partition protein [Candidatus Omnitrophota bacterium]MBU1656922.1 ParB/RepB/Spo0J family partition protein [Candidatus Omnitrophota bacterium]MBU1784834.1 ParB/RepB/Spo0J family partition protein [Candidatus Omnitrophota bacterium]MBU1850998.1 ParB/RepB/Spo0J family partition protein [Candidatus Omnitrophota bacterium]